MVHNRFDTLNLQAVSPGPLARILVAQPAFVDTQWKIRDHLYFFDPSSCQRLLSEVLPLAHKYKCNAVVLPELSVPEECVHVIKEWTLANDAVVISGSHYHRTDHGYISRCPIIYKGVDYFVHKRVPAPAEVTPFPEAGIIAGDNNYVFEDTPIGSFSVLICSDFLSPDQSATLQTEELDFLFVIACQRDSSLYYKRLDVFVESMPAGAYAIYCNSSWSHLSDGKSAFFGQMSDIFAGKLKAEGHTDRNPATKLIALNASAGYAVIEANIRAKRPPASKTVRTRPNVQVVRTGELKTPDDMQPFFPVYNNHRIAMLAIREHVRRLLEKHSLASPEWCNAFSSIYFLVKLARLLQRTNDDDYALLLNRFLEFFSFRENDTIELRRNEILVTPNESDEMLRRMRAEDEQNPEIASDPKRRLSSVNQELMHQNYLYGTALGITGYERSNVMHAVRENAIKHLLYSRAPSARDANGGWAPYRTPWVTARILISLSEANIESRHDRLRIDEVIFGGLESLRERVAQSGEWPSGAGDWVSKWESTALCIEAFLSADSERFFSSFITEVLSKVLSRSPEWLIEQPRLDEEESTNRCMASVLMVSVCVRTARFYNLAIDSMFPIDRAFASVQAAVKSSLAIPNLKQRQSCTIPQIAAYAVALTIGNG